MFVFFAQIALWSAQHLPPGSCIDGQRPCRTLADSMATVATRWTKSGLSTPLGSPRRCGAILEILLHGIEDELCRNQRCWYHFDFDISLLIFYLSVLDFQILLLTLLWTVIISPDWRWPGTCQLHCKKAERCRAVRGSSCLLWVLPGHRGLRHLANCNRCKKWILPPSAAKKLAHQVFDVLLGNQECFRNCLVFPKKVCFQTKRQWLLMSSLSSQFDFILLRSATPSSPTLPLVPAKKARWKKTGRFDGRCVSVCGCFWHPNLERGQQWKTSLQLLQQTEVHSCAMRSYAYLAFCL